MTTSTGSATPLRPGRLDHPDWGLRDDPRADPRMVAALAPFEMDGQAAPPPLGPDAPLGQQLEFATGLEEGFEAVFAALAQGLPALTGVERRSETIAGPDGDDLTLYLHRPTNTTGPLPGVLHLHGGGMVVLSATGPMYAHWRDSLASAGMVVIGVEFRNAGGVLGPHPFPAGLEDCSRALRWVQEHRDALGVSALIISGESGGANLSLATTLKAKHDGHLDAIDGVYGMCPYISGGWAERDQSLPSQYENDGYFLNLDLFGVLASVYDPGGENAINPLCWPFHASAEDLRDLPPHVISVNELDPLRDEGLAYTRTLLAAGVPTVGCTVNGTCHAGDLIFGAAMPDVHAATARDIAGFAGSL